MIPYPQGKVKSWVGEEKVSTNLRIFREKVGISQTELARKIGIARPLLAQVELGQRLPWPKLIKRAAQILDIPYSALEPDLKREGGK
jgi:transcriptional regulator with XRE-family HTH domain